MGFYYLLLLFIGMILLIVGALKKDVSRSVKIVIFLFVIGILFIATSLLLMMPGSSDIISKLIK
jgi:zinc transporter ZupT